MISQENVKPMKKAMEKPLAVAFYALFAFFFNYHFMVSSMLYRLHFNVHYELFAKIYDNLYYVLIGVAVISILFLYDGIRNKLLPIGILAVALLYNHFRDVTSIKAIAVFFLLLICAKGKNIKIWGWMSFICGWIWLLASFIGTRIGYIPDLTYDNGARHSFGIIYPTDLGCHILTLTMVLCVIRNGKFKIYDYAYMMLAMAVNILFIKAKVGFGCQFLLFAGSFYFQYIHPKKRLNQGVVQAYNMVCVLGFTFFAILTFALTLTYTPDSIINRIGFLGSIKSRFRLGREAFNNYPVTLWGTYIPEQGAGAKLENEITNYFFLDISYVRLLMLNGISIFGLAMIVYTKAQYHFAKNRYYYLMWILVIFALDCAVEHHMIEVGYGLMGFIMFMVKGETETVPATAKESVKTKERKAFPSISSESSVVSQE